MDLSANNSIGCGGLQCTERACGPFSAGIGPTSRIAQPGSALTPNSDKYDHRRPDCFAISPAFAGQIRRTAADFNRAYLQAGVPACESASLLNANRLRFCPAILKRERLGESAGSEASVELRHERDNAWKPCAVCVTLARDVYLSPKSGNGIVDIGRGNLRVGVPARVNDFETPSLGIY